MPESRITTVVSAAPAATDVYALGRIRRKAHGLGASPTS